MKTWLILGLLLLGGCEREQRQYQLSADEATSDRPERTRTVENAYAVSQGKQLYRWMNCIGCHAMGGGGMGPPHMDKAWRYGAEPKDIYESIMNGRPNGMPPYKGRITDDQAWQLVAYVRSMSALVSKDVAPGRSDGLSASEPENMREKP